MSEPAKAFERDKVVKIIQSVLSKVETTGGGTGNAIYNELKDLQKIIDDTRKEIGLSQPHDIKDKHIPTASDELDAVVEATAEATGKIMDACEALNDKAGSADDKTAAFITEETMKIFEACSFQDITGQRITKVVTTLKTIETKVDKLLDILGGKMSGTPAAPGVQSSNEDTRTGDEKLLNGPQMADQAISQDDIDKLLAEFDE